MTVGYGTNESHDGDQWPARRTHAVMPRLVAAIITTLLEGKLFVCSVFVLLLLDPSMCVVFCVFPLLWYSRHCAAAVC